MKKQLIKSAGAGIGESLVKCSILFFLTPFMLKELGLENYGLWILIMAILGFFNIFSMGLPTTIQRSITIHFSNKDYKSVNTTFSCGIFLFLIIGTIASLIIIILGINSQLISASNKDYLSFALLVLSINLFLRFIMMPFYGFFSALLRFDIDSYITTSCEVLRALLIVFLIRDLQLNGLIIAVLISDFLGYAAKILYVKKIYPEIKFSVSYISKDEILKLFNFSKHIMTSSLALSINVNADPIMINKLFNLNSVSLFSIPSRLCLVASQLVSSIVNISYPVFSHKFAKNEDLSNLFNTIVGINLSICSLFYLPILATNETFLRLWVGEEFKDALNIVLLLVFSLICQAYSKPIRDTLIAQGNHQKFAFINLVGSLLNILCSIIFASFIGITGIAAGTAIGFFITEIFLYSFLLKKYNHFSLKKASLKFSYTIVVLFTTGIVINHLIESLEIDNWNEFLLYGSLVGLFSLVISWFILLDRKLRSTLAIAITQQIKQRIT